MSTLANARVVISRRSCLSCLFGPCQVLACFYLSDHRPGAFWFSFFFFFSSLSTLSTGFYPLVDTPTFSFLSINFFVHSLGKKIFRNPKGSFITCLFISYFHLNQSQSFLLATASIRPLIIDIISLNCINKLPPPNLKRNHHHHLWSPHLLQTSPPNKIICIKHNLSWNCHRCSVIPSNLVSYLIVSNRHIRKELPGESILFFLAIYRI